MLVKAAARWASLPMARDITILAFDAMATLCGLYGALLLRLGGELPPEYVHGARVAVPLLVTIRLGAVVVSRVHRWSFHMSGLSEAARLAGAMLVASVVFVLAFDLVLPHGLPRTVYALEFFFTLSLMAALRFAPRIIENWYGDWRRRTRSATLRTIIVGSGRTGDLLARDLAGSEDGKYLVVGFVDDEAGGLGVHVSGKPVLGPIDDLPKLIERFRISTVLLAIPDLPAERVRSILRLCASSKASFKTIPASYAYLDQRISAAMLHDLSPDDLLGRDPSRLRRPGDPDAWSGAGACSSPAPAAPSAGRSAQQLAHHGVSRLVMVDMNENELYLRRAASRSTALRFSCTPRWPTSGSWTSMQQLGDRYQPEFVFHAAAHKHVPLMEDAPEEAVKNNVFGTLNVALMAHADRRGAARGHLDRQGREPDAR